MNLNLLAALLTLILISSAALINAWKIVNKRVEPTLSTWLIILAASLMSFGSYLISSNKDFVGGALNAGDVISTTIISIAIIIFGKNKWRLQSFEKYYLFVLVLIALFWFVTSKAFASNLLIQILISIGYIPTAHHIIKDKENKESVLVWSLILLASLVSLLPAIHAWRTSSNILSLVYSIRSIVMLSLMVILMFVYKPRTD